MDTTAFIRNYLKVYKPYKAYWNYEDGCVLMGCVYLYKATGDQIYRQFVLDYLDQVVDREGNITNYELEQYNIDSINSGKALYFALDETGEKKYRAAIEFVMSRLRAHPRCRCGSFWHKTIYPNQIWLDGLYMAQPFYMEYETRFDKLQGLSDILSQWRNVRDKMYCEQKGLFYHAYDEARIQPWADKENGCSHNFWLRSEGWMLMALVDCIALLDEQYYEQRRELIEILKTAIHGILRYRDEKTGLFLQVIDHPEEAENYAETSGSSMIAYALMKGAACGALNEEKYAPIGKSVFEALVEHKLVQDADGRMHLKDICKVAGLGPGEKRDGSVQYYLSEPKVEDDSKGVGPFMMAYAQYLKGM